MTEILKYNGRVQEIHYEGEETIFIVFDEDNNKMRKVSIDNYLHRGSTISVGTRVEIYVNSVTDEVEKLEYNVSVCMLTSEARRKREKQCYDYKSDFI